MISEFSLKNQRTSPSFFQFFFFSGFLPSSGGSRLGESRIRKDIIIIYKGEKLFKKYENSNFREEDTATREEVVQLFDLWEVI